MMLFFDTHALSTAFGIIFLCALIGGTYGRMATVRSQAIGVKLSCLPGHYMFFGALIPFLVGLFNFILYSLLTWKVLPLPPRTLWSGAAIFGGSGLGLSAHFIRPQFNARVFLERLAQGILMLSAGLTILITVAIILSIAVESLRFFRAVPFYEFFGTHWSPQTSADGNASNFGTIALFIGSFMITFIALLVATPLGLFAAIYMAFYAPPRARHILKPALEMLAGIPTVVYGFFAIITVAPWIRGIGYSLNLDIATESALVAGLVMGIMIIPFISSLSDDVLSALPRTLKDGSLGLGATYSETIRLVLLPAALPGIASAVLLAISRAIGETMLVVMAAGMSANLTLNPLQPVTTVTVQIVSILTGDQEFDSPKTLAAFALGLVLFVLTFILNMIAHKIVRQYRGKYETH